MLKWMKENMIVVVAIMLLLGFAGFGIVSRYWQHDSEKTSKTVQVEGKSETRDSVPVQEETPDEKNYRTAKLKLERPYTEGSAEQKQQVLEAFEQATNDIKRAGHLSKVNGTVENHLSMSQAGMVQTFAMALLVNDYEYQPSKLEVTQSENDDVVQFLITLTKNGEDNCYFVGNFNTMVNQIQLKSYVGGHIGGAFG